MTFHIVIQNYNSGIAETKLSDISGPDRLSKNFNILDWASVFVCDVDLYILSDRSLCLPSHGTRNQLTCQTIFYPWQGTARLSGDSLRKHQQSTRLDGILKKRPIWKGFKLSYSHLFLINLVCLMQS